MKFGTGLTTELTQKREGQSTKMPCVRPNIYKQTNIPDFQLCYPCKCLARSPIIHFLCMILQDVNCPFFILLFQFSFSLVFIGFVLLNYLKSLRTYFKERIGLTDDEENALNAVLIGLSCECNESILTSSIVNM